MRIRKTQEILEYLKDSLRKGDIVIHIGKTDDEKEVKPFYNTEVEGDDENGE